MGTQDRYYYREQSDHSKPLLWLISGSAPIMTVAGVRVRAHASLVVFVGLVLLMGGVGGIDWADRIVSMSALVGLLSGHELVLALAARGVGGFAEEIVLWPLGGLAQPQYPMRPGATFTAVLAGLVFYFVMATLAAGVLQSGYGISPPLSLSESLLAPGDWGEGSFYAWYVFVVSAGLLVLNVLPILPLDGGHLLHCVLWPTMGYGRSLLATSNVGIALGAGIGAWGVFTGLWLVTFVMAACVMYCAQKRVAIRTAGVWTFDEYDAEIRRPRRHRLSRFMKWKARRQIRQEEAAQVQVDAILEKIAREGLGSLSWWERRVLRQATERQREREMEAG